MVNDAEMNTGVQLLSHNLTLFPLWTYTRSPQTTMGHMAAQELVLSYIPNFARLPFLHILVTLVVFCPLVTTTLTG
jgi:hypothetical protein